MGVNWLARRKHRVHLGQDDEDGGNSHGDDDRAGEAGLKGNVYKDKC